MNKRGNNRAGRLVCGLLACVLIAAALPAAVWADETAQPPEAPAVPAASEPAGEGALLPEQPAAPEPSVPEQQPTAEEPADEAPLPPQEQPEPPAEPGQSEEEAPAAPERAPAAAAANGGAEPALRAGSADGSVSGQSEEQELAPRSGDEQEEQAQTARCTVIYWGEGLGEEAIFLYRTLDEQATVGSPAGYDNTLNSDLLPKGLDKNGFTFDPALTGAAPAVTADGRTVMNVYFARRTFAITFCDRDGQPLGEIRAKYGADISAQWTAWCEKANWGAKLGEPYPQYTMFSSMPARDFTVYQKEKVGQKRIEYRIENLDGGGYSLYAVFLVPGSVELTDEDIQPITGFTCGSCQKTGDLLWLQYTRNEYALHLVNGKGTETRTLKYEAPLADALPTPKPPEGLEEGSEFAGWYLSEEDGSQPFDATGGMPAHDLILYARWQPPVTVTYVTGREDMKEFAKRAHQGDLLRHLLPEMGPGFAGWYTDPAHTQKADPAMTLTEDLTLYAKWETPQPTASPEPTTPPGPTASPAPTATPAPATPGGSTDGTNGTGGENAAGGAVTAPDIGRAAAAVQSTPAPLTARPAVPVARPETPAAPAEPLTDPAAPLAGPEAAQTGPAVMRITIENPDGSSGGIDLGEETTPLAGPARHEDCVMHHLILLAAFVLELIYLSAEKKAQQRVFNARIELAEYKAQHPES